MGIYEILDIVRAFAGGMFIGIGESSATEGYQNQFRMAAVLGVDKDMGARVCHGKWTYSLDAELAEHLCSGIENEEKALLVKAEEGIYLTDGNTKVLSEKTLMNPIGDIIHTPTVTVHEFGEGKGVYLSHFDISPEHTRLLLNLLLDAVKAKGSMPVTDNAYCGCTYFPASSQLAVINNSEKKQITTVRCQGAVYTFTIAPFDMEVKYV